MRKKKPEELLVEWQKRLGLTDWEIDFEPSCTEEELDLDDCDACSTYLEVRKVAKVQMINPELRKDPAFHFDYEVALVHELLHLKLCMLEATEDWTDLQMRLLHSVLNDLAKALVDAKRSKYGA